VGFVVERQDKQMSRISLKKGKTRVVSKGAKPPEDGVKKGKKVKKTEFQKLLEKWGRR
jgi:hypothetical protein